MANDISFLFGKMTVGHGRILLAVSWSIFSTYQKSCHVLLLAQVVHFELESTLKKQWLGMVSLELFWNSSLLKIERAEK